MNDPAKRWSPYLLGGAAGYSFNFADGNIKALRPAHFGMQGGLGFEVRPTKETYFVEIRSMGIPPGGLMPLVVGMRF